MIIPTAEHLNFPPVSLACLPVPGLTATPKETLR